MAHARQRFGAAGETAAREYLEQLGYEVVAQNWHAGRYGEVDIIALQGGELVFVEVKTRAGSGFGNPEDAVTRSKQAKLMGAAQAFLLAHPQLPQQARFDVVAVVLSPEGRVAELKHFERLTFS